MKRGGSRRISGVSASRRRSGSSRSGGSSKKSNTSRSSGVLGNLPYSISTYSIEPQTSDRTAFSLNA